MFKKVFIVSSAVAAAVLILAMALSNGEKSLTSSLKSNLKAVVSVNRTDHKENDLMKIYIDIHQMSHHVIIADDKWGFKELTLENIQGLIEQAEVISSTSDTSAVLEILHRWEKGDFTEADRDHNFVWSKLGGTVGIATGVNMNAIPEWAKEMTLPQP